MLSRLLKGIQNKEKLIYRFIIVIVTLNGKRRCAGAKTIHGRETREIRNIRAKKLAELKFYFNLIK